MQIAQALLDQTKYGNIEWQSTDDDEAFLYSTSNSSIIIDTASRTGPQPYWLKILNQRGTVVETLDYNPQAEDEWMESQVTENKVGALLGKLHEAARRQALQIDDVINAVLRELKEMPPF